MNNPGVEIEVFLLIMFAIAAGITIVGMVISTVVMMWRNPDLSIWPAVTRCGICNKRVYVWQKHERRSCNVDLDNPNHVAAWVTSSAIVHKHCEGNPVMKISVVTT